jgi:predicted nucleic acid-binding protein
VALANKHGLRLGEKRLWNGVSRMPRTVSANWSAAALPKALNGWFGVTGSSRRSARLRKAYREAPRLQGVSHGRGSQFAGARPHSGPIPPTGRGPMRVLLDTCVLSELRRPKGHPAVRQAVYGARQREPLRQRDIDRRSRQRDRASKGQPAQARAQTRLQTLERYYADRLLPVNLETSRIWGRTYRRPENRAVRSRQRRSHRRDRVAPRSPRNDQKHHRFRAHRSLAPQSLDGRDIAAALRVFSKL